MHHLLYPLLLLLIFTNPPVVLARTDLTGCTSTSVSSPAGASIAWYVPETGEICDLLDCGGGRAPPKTTVPGCPLYSGTASYSPLYLAAGGGEMGVVFSSFSAPFATTAEMEGEAAVEMTTSTTTTSSYSSGVTLYSSPSPSPPPTTTTDHIASTSAPTTSIPSSSSPPPPPIILSSTNTTTTSIAEHGSRNGKTTTTSTTPSITNSGILPSSQQQQQQTSGATRKVVEIGKRGYLIGGLVEILCVVGGWGLLE